jgi:hypothetical protein
MNPPFFTPKRLAIFLMAGAAAFGLLRELAIGAAEAVEYNDTSNSDTAHVDRVCFYVQSTGDYSEVLGEVHAHTLKADGGMARSNAVRLLMSGANLAAAQNMLANQALPIWLANQAP